MNFKEIGWAEWFCIVFFSLIHPWAFVVAFAVYILPTGLSGLIAFLSWVIVSIIFYLGMLTWKHRRWKKVTAEPTNKFLHAAFWASLWYLPFALPILANFVMLAGASSDALMKGGGDLFVLIIVPIYLVGIAVLVPLSNLTFTMILKRHLQAQPAAPGVDVAKVSNELRWQTYGLVAIIIIIFGWGAFHYYVQNYINHCSSGSVWNNCSK